MFSPGKDCRCIASIKDHHVVYLARQPAKVVVMREASLDGYMEGL